jgi:photosystem II stability/assembly factor-like uncharacterized protein
LVGSGLAAGGGIGWVAFQTSSAGLWCNGTLLHTADAGDTWDPTATVPGICNDADFASATLGWAGWSNGSSEAGGGIARTKDGGLTWTEQYTRLGTDGSGGFAQISSPTTKRCYALKWGARAGVYATANAGADWRRRVLPRYVSRYRHYTDLDFPAARTGWVVGDSGRIAKTVTSGALWVKQRSRCTARLYAVDFVDARVGFVVGNGGRVLRTVDGGRHWVRLASGTTKGLRAVCFVDRYHGWVAGNGGVLLRTANGGRTWKAAPPQ